ncbi:MAG TPA: tetratricopeptide repeat protein [Polyangia bacterium]|nr:tetratricopeptide repeat protein [Polyangia bacterium]
MNRSFILAACLASALFSLCAQAADPSPDLLIEQGLALRRSGKPEEALELFRHAHALAPSSRTFGQMGLVETSLKQWVDAENHLSVALSNPDDRWVAKNRAFLDEALGLCRQHVGDLVVSGPAGVEIFVSGKSVGTLPTVPAIHLVEGSVVVSARAEGFKPFEQTAAIRPGVRSSLTVAMAPVALVPIATVTSPPRAASPPPSPPLIVATSTSSGGSTPSTWHGWAGISLAVVGVAAAGWGVALIAVDGHDTGSTTACPAPDQDKPCPNLYSTRTTGWILAGAGAAAIAGGATIFFTGRHPADASLAIAPGSFLLRARF